MGWNGSGTFNRLFSWVADKAAGLDISSTRMDADTNDIAAQGFGNCLTRNGEGQPSANLPMAGFRHTGVQNAVNRSDYAAFGQLQDGLINWTAAGGTADALTATFTPALTVLADGQLCFVRAATANLTTTPTFAPNGLTARNIVKNAGNLLAAGDIAGVNHELILRYNQASFFWELLNPSNTSINNSVASTGVVWLTLASAAPTGWLMFDDGTFGSATSGSSNSNSALNQALFNILFAAPFTDATCPLLTSTGAGTTRAGQGTAAAAWAANCRMTLPKMLGRALAIAGTGAGLTARTMGLSAGAETVALATGNLPAIPYTPAGTIVSTTNAGVSGLGNIQTTGGAQNTVGPGATVTSTFTGTPAALGGSATAFSVMQPSEFLNAIVKQ